MRTAMFIGKDSEDSRCYKIFRRRLSQQEKKWFSEDVQDLYPGEKAFFYACSASQKVGDTRLK